MLPSFLGMIVFSFLPIIISIAISFTNWNGLDKLSYKTLASNFVFWITISRYSEHQNLEGFGTYLLLYCTVYSDGFDNVPSDCLYIE